MSSNLAIPLVAVVAIAIMALVMYSDIIKSKLYGDKRLFYTYTPQAYQPGKITDDGKTITRVVEVMPTMTTDGGVLDVSRFVGGEIMSRIVFTDKDEFLRWIKKNCKPSQYEIHVTSFSEIIMKPIKSTRSLSYAYIEIYDGWTTIDDAEKDMKSAIPRVDIFHVKKFDWDHTMSVAVKQVA